MIFLKGSFSLWEPQKWNLQSYLYKTKKGCICMKVILNYVVQCRWCWLTREKNPFTTCGSGQPTASWKCSLVQSWERNSVSPPLFLYFYFFHCGAFKSFSFACLLVSLQKEKGTFLTLRKSREKKARIFKCAKSNSFSKTVDSFLSLS